MMNERDRRTRSESGSERKSHSFETRASDKLEMNEIILVESTCEYRRGMQQRERHGLSRRRGRGCYQ